jgi:hypothetical protein
MNRRLFSALVGTTAVAVVLFAGPLALVLARMYHDQQVLELQRQATAATINIPDDQRRGEDIHLPQPPPGGQIGYYAPDGRLAAGEGPRQTDPVTTSALVGASGDAIEGDQTVGAVPVDDDRKVISAVRGSDRAAWRPHR